MNHLRDDKNLIPAAGAIHPGPFRVVETGVLPPLTDWPKVNPNL